MILNSLRRAGIAAALTLPFLAGACAVQQGVDAPTPAVRPVVVDGHHPEWEGVPVAATARVPDGHAPSPYPRPLRVQVRHDRDGVYLLVGVDSAASLQGLPGPLVLVMNADGDPATGWAAHGVPGVDAALELSPVWPDGLRGGIGLRLHDPAGDSTRLGSAYDAGVVTSPSHASRTFEIRIGRGGAVRFGERMTARLLSLDAQGAVAASLAAFTVDLADPAARPVPRGHGVADPLARPAAADFRVVSWNVGREAMFERPEAFGAILRALSPDVLMLDEVAGGHSAAEVEALLNRLVPGDRPWRAVYGASGGSQRQVIATRGAAPAVAPPFDRPLPYPDSARALVPADTTPRAHEWLRSRLESHVPATGAVVEAGGRRLLAVAMDLESGGTPGSPKDRLRVNEALAVRGAVRAALPASGVDGLLLSGDLNLVGTREPLALLTADPGENGRWLTVAQPLRLDDASDVTWRDPEEPFAPGRLDYVIFSPALEWVGGFVFRSGDLSAEWQARHGLVDDTSGVTDHLPIVTDLRWVEPR